MIIILFGPPASGKGTQAELLADKFGYFHLSTGELFRSMKKSDPELAKFLDKGDLVPDDKVIEISENYIEKNNLFNGLILDGSPRSLYQYRHFKKFFSEHGKSIDYAVYIKISDEEAVKRLSARRFDSRTGKIYNMITNPPPDGVNKDDLVQRDDDKPEAIKERLRTQKVPSDLYGAIKKDGILVEINGEQPIEKIFNDILGKIEVNK